MTLMVLGNHSFNQDRDRYPSHKSTHTLTPSSSSLSLLLPQSQPRHQGIRKTVNRPFTSSSTSTPTPPFISTASLVTESITPASSAGDLAPPPGKADSSVAKIKPRSKSFKGLIMPYKLVKGGREKNDFQSKSETPAQTEHTALLCNYPEGVHTLLPSPVIQPPTSPLSPLLPPARDRFLAPSERKRGHRRSRSFSEVITSSTSSTANVQDDQPWRSREAWLALHSRPKSPPGLVMPSAMGDEGWRAKGGGGTFFGADMNIPLPGNQRVRSKPSSPTRPIQFTSHAFLNGDVGSLSTSDLTTLPTPGSMGPATVLYRHVANSARHIPTPDDASSDEDHLNTKAVTRWHTPIAGLGENETEFESDTDLLPPLLPRTVTRTSSFSSISRNTTPIPWAQRSVVRGGSPSTRTPNQSPRTPSRQGERQPCVVTLGPSHSQSILNASSPLASLDRTPKTWLQVDHSPPRGQKQSSPPLSLPITPRTPPSPRRKFHLNPMRAHEESRRQGSIRRSTSPQKAREEKGGYSFSHHDHERHHTEVLDADKFTPKRSPSKYSTSSPSKKFWRVPIEWAADRKWMGIASREERKTGQRRGSIDQSEK